MKYKLTVKTVNKTFIVKGKPIRTPLVIENLSENDLNRYLHKIKLEGIRDNDYIVEEMTKSSRPKTTNKNSRPKEKINQPELNEYNSTLEEFLNIED